MFTGIVECVGEIIAVQEEGTNRHFQVESKIGQELKIDQSVSHEGACLTVTKLEGNRHWVTAIEETLMKTNLRNWEEGKKVNLERCMKANGRYDGHIVQGHVDTVATVSNISENDGSSVFNFQVDNTNLIVEKGSICINGTSLTCFDVTDTSFSVAIIPFTLDHTTFQDLGIGDHANIEFDILGKYVQKMMKINP